MATNSFYDHQVDFSPDIGLADRFCVQQQVGSEMLVDMALAPVADHATEVRIYPGERMERQQFLNRELPSHVGSAALDGYVLGNADRSDPKRQIFDHHGSLRASQPAAFEQVMDAILDGGLFEAPNGELFGRWEVFANGCDQDASPAIWALYNRHAIRQLSADSLGRLMAYAVDVTRLDRTNGAAAAYMSDEALSRNAYINGPFDTARVNGDLARTIPGGELLYDSAAYYRTVLEIGHRINQVVIEGNDRYVDIDFESVRLAQMGRVGVFDETSNPHARLAMFRRYNPEAYVCHRGNGPGGAIVTVGLRDASAGVCLERFFESLRAEEPGWGGCSGVGGSGAEGTAIELEDIAERLHRYIDSTGH